MNPKGYRIPYLKMDRAFPINATLSQFLTLKNYVTIEASSEKPWVVIKFLGVFPIFAHYDIDAEDFWKIPSNLGFKVRIDPEKYNELLTQYKLQKNDDTETAKKLLPAFSFFQERDIFSYILQNQLWRIDEKLNKLDMDKASRLLRQQSEVKWGVEALLKGYSVVPLCEMRIEKAVKEKLPKNLCERFKAMCYAVEGKNYFVVMDSPAQAPALEDELNSFYTQTQPIKIIPSYAPKAAIEGAQDAEVNKVLNFELSEDSNLSSGQKIFYCDRYNESSEEAMWIDPKHALALILKKAIREGASDIHIQEGNDRVDVRFRLNTFLANRLHFPKKFLSRINSIISQYGGIDPIKKLIPHSGRFTAIFKDVPFEVRVSMIPMGEEQSCVMRIHGEKVEVQSLETLHLNYKDETLFKDALTRKSGIILITGPTGSGKSTTLYAALKELNREDVSIETIEDPIEKRIAGIKQFQVRYASDKEKSLTFPKLFREILRHDPDVIMVGEIRDLETANQAVIAAQTGHLVLSTLHTQDAIGAIPRLISEGVNPQHLADALILLQAQRLIGTVCKNCRRKVEKDSSNEKTILEEFYREGVVYNEKDPIYEAGKCEYCNQTGYEGKQAIFELFSITNEVREKIAFGKNIHEIRKCGPSVGYRTLYQEGLQQVALGITTFEEVFKYRNSGLFDFQKLLKESQERLKIR